MKKLSKLNLKNFHEMSDGEMKNVVGGSTSYAGDNCLKSCECPNGTKYQVSCDWSCSESASTACS